MTFRKDCTGSNDVFNQTTKRLFIFKPYNLRKRIWDQNLKILDGDIKITGDFSRCQEVTKNPLNRVIRERLTSREGKNNFSQKFFKFGI